MSNSFKEKLQNLKDDVAEAEQIANAVAPQNAPRVSLVVCVVANAGNLADLKRCVQVERIGSTPDAPAVPLEWISEEELNTRLLWLRKMQSTYPGTTLEVDVWSAGKTTPMGSPGGGGMPGAPGGGMMQNADGQFSSLGGSGGGMSPMQQGERGTPVFKAPTKEPTLDEVRRFRAELAMASWNLEQVRAELDELEQRKTLQAAEQSAGNSSSANNNGLDGTSPINSQAATDDP